MDHRTVHLIIETDRHRIAGFVHLPANGYRSRATDILNNSDRDFIAITDAKIEFLGVNGQPLHKSYLAVAKKHIVLAMSGDQDGDQDGDHDSDVVARFPAVVESNARRKRS
jgi:hypothetical protein